MTDKTLGHWIRFLRLQNQLTQKELVCQVSALAQHKISDSTVSAYEHGKVPGRLILPAYARALNVTLDDLLNPPEEELARTDFWNFKP
jgi:transcriptional regulator with XRE-family HTH domain